MNGDDKLKSKQPAEKCEVQATAEWIMNVHNVDIVPHKQRVQLVKRVKEVHGKANH
jgi:hypothetical protein